MSLLQSRLLTAAPVSASAGAVLHLLNTQGQQANTQELTFSIYHKTSHCLHSLPKCLQSPVNCAAWRQGQWPENSDPSKLATSLAHIAHSMEFPFPCRIVLQHLCFGIQMDTSSPSIWKQVLANMEEGGVSQICNCSQSAVGNKAMVVVFFMLPAKQLIWRLFYQTPNILTFMSQLSSPAIS